MKDQDVVDVNYEVLTLLKERCCVNPNTAIAQFGLTAKQAECLASATRAQLRTIARTSRPVFQLHVGLEGLDEGGDERGMLCQLLRGRALINDAELKTA